MHAIVLGVNGVVLTSERAREVFRRRSVEFVANKTGEDARNAELLEFHARNTYGNAALGLKAFRPDLKISAREYASFVYDDRVVGKALDAADSDPAFGKDKYNAKSALAEAAACGASVFLFTSSTHGFVEALLDRMGISHLVDERDIFACDVVSSPHTLMKPTDLSFVVADYALRSKCGRDSRVLFVDGDLGTVMHATRAGVDWYSTHFDSDNQRLVETVKFFLER